MLFWEEMKLYFNHWDSEAYMFADAVDGFGCTSLRVNAGVIPASMLLSLILRLAYYAVCLIGLGLIEKPS